MQDDHVLLQAFPTKCEADVRQLIALFPSGWRVAGSFDVFVAGERLTIPKRLYVDRDTIDRSLLTARQTQLLDCLLTRHNDGFVRQEHLSCILDLDEQWIPPFVIQLAGEYVLEILDQIWREQAKLRIPVFSRFVAGNPAFMRLTEEHIISYWDCYYRRVYPSRDEYGGLEAGAISGDLRSCPA